MDRRTDCLQYTPWTNPIALHELQQCNRQGLITMSHVRRVPANLWDSTTVAEVMAPAEDLPTATPSEQVTCVLDRLQVATGGLAGSIIPYCRREIICDDNLLLKGLWILYQKNVK